MPRIFISYRREDTAGYNLMLAEELGKYFDRDDIFMDIDSIRPGVDFRKVLQDQVQSCDVVIVLIGRTWLTATNDKGERRLDSPEDWVRIEVATALERDGILVIPTLVHGASIPAATQLPADLQDLAYRNAIELSDNRFQYDVKRLAGAIRGAGAGAGGLGALTRLRSALHRPSRRTVAVGAPAVGVLGVAAFFASRLLFPPDPAAPPMGINAFPHGTMLVSDSLRDVSTVLTSVSQPPNMYVNYSAQGYNFRLASAKWLTQYTGMATPISGSTSTAGAVAVDARLVGDATGRFVAAGCGYSAPAKASGPSAFWARLYPADGTVILEYESNGADQIQLQKLQSPYIHGGDAWNRLELSCLAGTLTVTVNGHQLTPVTVPLSSGAAFVPSGQMALETGELTPGAADSVHAQFANLQVRVPRTLVSDSLQTADGDSNLSTQNYKNLYMGFYKGSYWIISNDKSYLDKNQPEADILHTKIPANVSVSVYAALMHPNANRNVSISCGGYTSFVHPNLQEFDLFRNTKVVTTLTGSSAINRDTAWNRLQMTCNGKMVVLAINNVIVDRITNARLTPTSYVFGAGTYAGEASSVTAQFQDLEVDAL